ncbi:N-acetylmuramoyl-L-alanine amidase [Aerococcaceae bacterium DSM 111020]|nr:N-acetylmuramoyl-L-alanine amidase [Aerococcaceae bacterium DSM 111020]
MGLINQATIKLDTEVPITLREEPGTNQVAIAELEPGTEYQIQKSENNWLLIETQNQQTGWIPNWQLENPMITDDQSLAGQATDNTVLYAEDNVSSIALENIPPDTYFPIQHENNGWAQVEYAGRIGYVQSRFVHILSRDEVPQEELEKQEVIPEEIAEEEELDENTVIMRQANQVFLEQPDYDSEVLYNPDMYEEFQFISATENEQGEFYLVANSNGNRGYIESRVASLANDSINHQNEQKVHSMNDAVIVIDAGHGGTDPGAISQDQSTYEKNVTLSTAIFLQNYLEEMGATVIQTRADDMDVSLADRANLSNQNQADVFVSLHYDAGYDPALSGTTSYYYHQADYDLAQSVNEQLTQGPLNNHGVLFGNFQVLRDNQQPALLLELGYMSNPQDLGYIRSEEYQQNIAQAIANGIRNQIENPTD